jgi:hypothetical protein
MLVYRHFYHNVAPTGLGERLLLTGFYHNVAPMGLSIRKNYTVPIRAALWWKRNPGRDDQAPSGRYYGRKDIRKA